MEGLNKQKRRLCMLQENRTISKWSRVRMKSWLRNGNNGQGEETGSVCVKEIEREKERHERKRKRYGLHKKWI